VIRLATGQSTQRSELDAAHLTRRLREVAVQQLEQAPEDEVWLIADSSDLRKPYAEVMPYLMPVRDLDQQLVPGYRTQSADWADAWTPWLALSSAFEQPGP
jgi:hypothetical protein